MCIYATIKKKYFIFLQLLNHSEKNGIELISFFFFEDETSEV
jgi:hypothetical protein